MLLLKNNNGMHTRNYNSSKTNIYGAYSMKCRGDLIFHLLSLNTPEKAILCLELYFLAYSTAIEKSTVISNG